MPSTYTVHTVDAERKIVVPTADELSTIDTESDLAKATGNGSDPAGLYARQDGGWERVNDPTEIDADTVDGYEGAELGVLDEDETVSGTWTFNNTISGDIDGDADTLDGQDRIDIVGKQRHRQFVTGGDVEYIKLCRLKDKAEGANGGGGARFLLDFAEERGSSPVRSVSMTAFAKGSSFNAEHVEDGTDNNPDDVDLVITEDTGDGSDTDHQYYVYVRCVDFAAAGVRITPGAWFGQHDYEEGLSSGDLVGSIVYDTGADAPSRYVRVGTVESNGSRVVTQSDVGDGLAVSGNDVGLDVIDSDSVTLSSGAAEIDTGVSKSTTATFQVAIGGATDDARVAAETEPDSGTGNHIVRIVETSTSVGNPTVNYDIIRVR